MDLNKTIEFSTSSASIPVQDSQMHNFMSMPAAFMSPNNHQQYVKDGEATKNHRFKQLLKQNIQLFWNHRLCEIRSASEFRTHHQLPLARVKKIMKADEGVKMISADTPVLFAKACELFILELTLRSWLHTEENKRRTLQRCDIARAVRNEKLLDFLTDVVPLDHKLLQEEVTRSRSEGNESHHPASRTHLPMANLNSAYIMRNQEIPQQFVIQPSISSAEYQAGSKGKFLIKPQ